MGWQGLAENLCSTDGEAAVSTSRLRTVSARPVPAAPVIPVTVPTIRVAGPGACPLAEADITVTPVPSCSSGGNAPGLSGSATICLPGWWPGGRADVGSR
jgi:hypothetical protein